ncbi:MAG: cyclic nucleotide-binding domain-containing protein [Caldilinea sp.]|nr:cyclic nucleotide-binding domain-containing protein [Caldilinea sp.]MDW8440852.1 cyclic nucleotide-binding domain-containing protein [Caldilineaceae bacterium]
MSDAAVFDATPLDRSQIRALQLNFLAEVDRTVWEPILLGAIHRLYLPPFKMLYRQDKPVTAVYILASGRINQYREETIQGQKSRLIARTVSEGKLLGHLEFLFGGAYVTSARSEDACELLAIDARAFSRLIYHFPKLRDRLFPKAVADRLSTFPFMRRLALSPALHPIVSGFLADETTLKNYQPGQTIYQHGDLSEHVYLIHQGQVQLELAGHLEETHLLGNGAMFGAAQYAAGFIGMGSIDRYMLHDATSQTNTQLYCIPYHSFKSITGLDPEKVMREDIGLREQMIDQLSIFARLNAEERRAIAGYVNHFYLPHVRLLIHQGEAADSLWVLMEGRAAVRALDAKGRLISSAMAIGPTYFAEQALLGQVPQESTVEAQAGSEWLRFHWRDLEAVSKRLGADLRPRLKIEDTGVVAARDKKSKHIRYDWLEPGENVAMRVRRHWIAFFIKNLPAILLFFGTLALYWLSGWTAEFAPGMEILLRAATILVLALDVAALIWGTIDYWNDWLIITDLRVIHQEKVLFITEIRNEAPLEQIQNVNQHRTLLGKLLNYGAITVETAATVGVIRFDYAKDFDALRTEIESRRRSRLRHAEAASRSSIQRALEARLGLAVEIPSRVYRGGAPVSQKPSLWKQLLGRLKLRPRRPPEGQVVWRKHWLVLVPRLWFPLLVLLFMMLFAVLPTLSEMWGASEEALPFLNLLTVLGVIAMLIALGNLIWVIADWRNDTYEVSDEEIVHVDRMPLGLSEDRKTANLGRIQNVTMAIPSPLHWLFNYGDVRCQTAAEGGSFDFIGVPNPRMVAQEILKRMENYRLRSERQAAVNRAKDLPDWFEMYNRIEPEVLEERIQRNG